MKTSLTCIWIFLATALLPVYAGVELTVVERTFINSVPTETRGQMRMEGMNITYEPGEGASGPLGVIFQGKHGRILNLDHQRRSYTVLDNATLKKLAAAMKRAFGVMEQRGQGGAVQPVSSDPGTLVKTEKERKIGDHSCRRWDFFQDGVKKAEVWVAPWEQLGLQAGDLLGMYLMEEFQRRIQQTMPRSPTQTQPVPPVLGLRRLDGFPVRMMYVNQGRLTREVTHENVRTADFPPAIFEPPVMYMEKIIAVPGS